MAKSKSGMKIIMDGLRHTNLQTLGADSSTPIAEAISNPAYLESNPNKRQGMLIRDVRIFPEFVAQTEFTVGATHTITNQIRTGNHEDTPLLVEPNEPTLVAHAMRTIVVATGVGFVSQDFWPLQMYPMMGLPLIVTPQFTVTHDFDNNNAAYQNKDLYTIIDYAIVEVDNSMFSTLLLNQSRTS